MTVSFEHDSTSTKTQISLANLRPLPVQPLNQSDYTLTYQVLDAAQAVIAESAITVQVVEEAVVKVELLRQAPQNSALNIEPNQPIELYFNKAIDATKLGGCPPLLPVALATNSGSH